MANYSIIINSKFKPFSYAEMLAPVQESTQAHQQVEEAYSALSTQAESIAAKANEQTDPKAYARYKAYAEQLQAQAEQLARNGLTPDSRRNMFRMRDMYARQILPIQEAIQKRKEISDLQFKAQLANPTLLVGKKAATTSLDEFLDNPNIDFSQQYSGAMLTQQVAQQASALANELQSYGKGKPIDPYTYTFLKRYGFTRAEVLKAISDPNASGSSRVLSAIVDSVLQSSGVPQWADQATMERARAYANQGLWSAIGKADVGTLENFGARQLLEANLQDRNNARSAARSARAAGRSGGSGGSRGTTVGGYAGPNKGYIQPLRLDPQTITLTGSDKRKGSYYQALHNLGLGTDKNGKVTKIGKVTVNYRRTTPSAAELVNLSSVNFISGKDASRTGRQAKEVTVRGRFNLYDSNQRLLSRDKFVAQGKTAEQQKALRQYYNDMVMPSIDRIGGNSQFAAKQGGYHPSHLGQKALQYRNKYANVKLDVFGMNTNNNRAVVQNGPVGEVLQHFGGAYQFDADAFNGKNGEIVSPKIPKNTIMKQVNAKDKDGTYKNQVLFYNYFGKGKAGFIMQVGDDKYFIPGSNVSKNVANAAYKFNQTNPDIQQALSIRKNLSAKYGSWENILNAESLVMNGQWPVRSQEEAATIISDSRTALDIEMGLKNANISNISAVGDALLGTYKGHQYEFAKQASTSDQDQYASDGSALGEAMDYDNYNLTQW